MLPGFHAGVTADINIAENFYIQPGLLFSTKGYKYQRSQDGAKGTGTETPYYLELPLNLVFKPAIGSGHLLLGVGPYIGYGMSGKWKIEVAQGNSSLSQKGKLNFKNDMPQLYLDSSAGAFGLPETMTYAKPFDAGAALLAGYALSNNLSFQLNGQLGLLNIQPTVSGRNTKMILKNMQFGVSVGYRF